MAKKAKAGWRIVVASGVNLDLLGSREKDIYGTSTLADVEALLSAKQAEIAEVAGGRDVELCFFQTNDEARYLERLSERWDGAVLNPGAWTHTSLALADRLVALSLPFVEVHLSNLARREEFRRKSHPAPHAVGVVYGFGIDSYLVGLFGLLRHLQSRTQA